MRSEDRQNTRDTDRPRYGDRERNTQTQQARERMQDTRTDSPRTRDDNKNSEQDIRINRTRRQEKNGDRPLGAPKGAIRGICRRYFENGRCTDAACRWRNDYENEDTELIKQEFVELDMNTRRRREREREMDDKDRRAKEERDRETDRRIGAKQQEEKRRLAEAPQERTEDKREREISLGRHSASGSASQRA